MVTLKDANQDTQKAYYNQYFALSTNEEPYKFFEEERILFWATDLIDFMIFVSELKAKLVIYIDVDQYKIKGMDYLLKLTEAYKQQIRQLKNIELYGVIKQQNKNRIK